MSGLDHGILELELIQCINYIRDGGLLKLMQAQKHIYQQWRIILDHNEEPFCGVLRKPGWESPVRPKRSSWMQEVSFKIRKVQEQIF